MIALNVVSILTLSLSLPLHRVIILVLMMLIIIPVLTVSDADTTYAIAVTMISNLATLDYLDTTGLLYSVWWPQYARRFIDCVHV